VSLDPAASPRVGEGSDTLVNPMPETAQTQPDSSLTRGQVLGFVSLCLIWGTTWLAISFLVHDVPPLQAASLRFLIASVVLIGLAFSQKRSWPAERPDWKALLVLGFTMMAFPFGLVFWAEQYVASSMTAILYSSSPLLVTLLTPIMTGNKVPRGAVLAMVVGFGAILVLFYHSGLGASGRSLLGGVALLASVSSSAWSAVYAKQRLQRVDPVVATGLQLLFGSVVLFWGTWALESRRHAHWTPPALIAFVFLTVVGSCVAFVVYYWLLKGMQPYQLATTALIVPIIAVLEGTLIKHESVPLIMVLVIVVLLGSVASVLRAEVRAGQEGNSLALRGKAS